MKINITVDDVLKEENVNIAIEFLKSKKNVCGDDGVFLHELDEFWKINGNSLKEEIKQGNYIPQIVHEKVITMANGKHRKIVLMASVDRMLLRAIMQVIQNPIETNFSEYSFAYQRGKGSIEAVKYAAEYMEAGYEWVVEVDVRDFFDRINHLLLLKILRENLMDDALYTLVEKYIVCRVESDYQVIQKNIGISQGSPLSPLLSNLYLMEFDKWMEEQEYLFVRFADNINVYVKSLQEGYAALTQIKMKLREYYLEVNEEKTGVFSAFSRRYLGYTFEKIGTKLLYCE